jgi:hypothetical protein
VPGAHRRARPILWTGFDLPETTSVG